MRCFTPCYEEHTLIAIIDDAGIPAIFFLLGATVLLILTSISLPYLPALDIVRIHFRGQQPDAPNFGGVDMSEARVRFICSIT